MTNMNDTYIERAIMYSILAIASIIIGNKPKAYEYYRRAIDCENEVT